MFSPAQKYKNFNANTCEYIFLLLVTYGSDINTSDQSLDASFPDSCLCS